jgi:hypothetical protein
MQTETRSESSKYSLLFKSCREIPEQEAMALLRKGLEALRPFGPIQPEKLHLMYAGVSDSKNQTHPGVSEVK